MNWLEIALAILAAGLAVALYRQLRELGKLRRWASQSRLDDPPEAEGSWGEVFNLLHRHRRATLKRRQELARVMVRSRRGAQALPYGVAVLDASYRLDWCNDAARQQLGLDPERDRNQPIVNMVRAPEFVEYLRAADFSEPLRLAAPGNRRTLSVQLVPFGDDDHLLLSQDVTGAARVEAMRRDFVANVSHELRTPLTVLAGFLETIQDLKLDAGRVRDYVGLMAPQAQRMKHLIDDLLTLSSLEHAPPPPAAERVVLRTLLERVRSEAESLSGGKHRISLEAAGGYDLLGAEAEISSAFVNLVSNAIRYTPAGGEIRLRWNATEAGAEFSVADTGIGIDPEHLPRLTERFYRVDRGRSRETGGTGLGLSIVRHALARHQAVLDVDSVPGKGSRFSARFPAARLAPVAQKVEGVEGVTGGTGSPRA
jgi:two-component system phosphate regulon sensor histidine kinase PhoR